MKIEINNQLVELADGSTVATMISTQEEFADGAGVAVAVNGNLVKRPNWDAHVLNNGDKVLIIKAAYGG
jgi:sulfur carrier protein